MSIRSFVDRIWTMIKALFSHFPTELKNAINIGVLVTENIKFVIDSPVIDVLTAVIPGDIDDKLKEALRALLPEILQNLKLATSCENETDSFQVTQCAIITLQAMDGNIRNAFLHNLSILVALVASDGKLTWSDGVFLLEWYYQNKFKKA